MHEKSILTLEYPKILEKVAKEAAFSASKVRVMELEPTPNLEEARRRLAYTTEAYQLIELRADAGVQGARDIRQHLERAAREGVWTPEDIVEGLATTQRARCAIRPALRCASCASTSGEPTSACRIACARSYTNLVTHCRSPS